MTGKTLLIAGGDLGNYGFPDSHPFGRDRYGAFMAELERSAIAPSLARRPPRLARSSSTSTPRDTSTR
jgi:hypothetical protein